ncbi:MAG: AbrB/MazE/SpoVT family DNA-binding domain-containing protein [Gemmatimonadota bacterium]
MSRIATTKLSSRGQVVIPEEIRTRLGLETGAQFVVLGEGDTVILKAIRPPSREEFEELLARARAAAAEAGLTEEDIRDAIREAREEQ